MEISIFKETVLFLGAGASYPQPTCLPLFLHVRKAITDELGIPCSDLLNLVAPESIFFYMSNAGIPLVQILRQLFSSHEPNAIHHLAAYFLKKGGSVWTTNVDELIEKVVRWNYTNEHIAIGKFSRFDVKNARYFKLHGTISVPRTLSFQTPEVLNPFPDEWNDMFIQDFTSKNIVIVGYAGIDPDVRILLEKALVKAKSAIWFELPNKCELLEKRYENSLKLGILKVIPSINPAIDFFNFFKNLNIHKHIPLNLQDSLELHPNVRIDLSSWKLKNNTLVTARLFEHIGLNDKAESCYRKIRFPFSLKIFYKRIYFTIGFGLYKKRKWASFYRTFLRLSTRIPILNRNFNILIQESRLLEREGEFIKALVLAKKAYSLNPSPLNALDVCAPARKSGEFSLSEDLSSKAIIQLSVKNVYDGTVISRAYFELVYAYYLSGKIKEANNVLYTFQNGLNLYGGPNWHFWGLYLKGILLSLNPDFSNEALDVLEESYRGFLEMGDKEKAASVKSSIISLLRFMGKTSEANITLSEAKNLRASLSYRSIYEEESLLFEEAELERLNGNYKKAYELYFFVKKSYTPLHEILALLGLGELQKTEKTKPTFSIQAFHKSEKINFLYGKTHALVSIYLSEGFSYKDIVDKICYYYSFVEYKSLEMMLQKITDYHVISFPS